MRETKPEWLCMPKKSHDPGGQHRCEYKPFNGPNRSHRVSSEGIQLAIDHGRIKDFSGLLKWSAILITIFECGQSSKRPAEEKLMVPNGDAPLWKWKLCKFHFVNPCWLLCRWVCLFRPVSSLRQHREVDKGWDIIIFFHPFVPWLYCCT